MGVMRRTLLALFAALALAWSAPGRAQEWTTAPPPHDPTAGAVEEPTLPPDPPRDWITMHGSFVRVHGPPEHHALLLRIARHASDALPRLADALGVPIGTTIHLYVADSDATFRELQPGLPPTWADATAWPRRGIIFLRTPEVRGGMARPIEQVLEHELVHILLGRAFAPHATPNWLQEGVAQVMAGEYSPDTTRELARGLLMGELISLQRLSRGFPTHPVEARLAYAQSADFVSWLRAKHGEESLRVLVREMSAGKGIEAAVHAATGRMLDDVDRAWREGLVSSPLALTPVLEGLDVLLLGAGGILLVGAGVMRRRRFRRRLEEMERQERLVDELLAQTRAEARRDPGDLRVH